MSCSLYTQLVVLCCIGIIFGVSVDDDLKKDGTLQSRGRTGRYGYFDNLDNRLPYNPNVQNRYSNPLMSFPEFHKNPTSLSKPKYEVPSGFDQFVPGKDITEKYSYGPGGFYLPHSSKGELDFTIEEVEQKGEGHISNSIDEDESSNVKDLAIKGMKVLTGTTANTEIETESFKPSFLSIFRRIFKEPIVLLAVAFVPLSFLVAIAFPYLSKMFGSSMLPDVTTTIASGFARSLDGNLNVEQVLDTINEYGVKTMEDPRCFKRFFCEAARSQIESRSADSWSSIQDVIQKLAKAVDDRVWKSLGLNVLLSSVQNGNCGTLKCTGSAAYTQDLPLMDKIRLLGSKLFSLTELVH